jgi:hypothetical protein
MRVQSANSLINMYQNLRATTKACYLGYPAQCLLKCAPITHCPTIAEVTQKWGYSANYLWSVVEKVVYQPVLST